jgi:ferric iron reductase protein FhuF
VRRTADRNRYEMAYRTARNRSLRNGPLLRGHCGLRYSCERGEYAEDCDT